MRIALLATVSCLTAALTAADAPGGKPGPPPFELIPRIERAPEMGELTCYDLQTARGRFTFLPPGGWKADLRRDEQRLILRAPDYTAQIEIRMAPANPALAPKPNPDALRPQVLDRFPSGRLLEQFTCYTDCAAGLAFDVEWRVSPNVRSTSRLAFVPCRGGTWEFCLTTTPEHWLRHQATLGALLTSFHEHDPEHSASENTTPPPAPGDKS